ncbi:hypothetical protein D9758_018576 [Tetrapyrgos nigripes]|uniref:Uncharacterized protein n=1 Tax=Tetrapyrgos nigripes TaxID=182062 RepID=A0A8H5EWD7_9AGAR|nr:hypothetical protein D9758_018576 [Tetrapyrgos nigripes]
MGPGFLIVYSELGKEGSLNKFQDLYNWHKHVSLPLHHLKSFLSGARYLLPTPIFLHGSLSTIYMTPRLSHKQEILDRRTSEGHTDLDESSLSSSLKSGNPAKYLVTHGRPWGGDGESEKAAREWVETSVTELKKTEGWVTTRTFRVIDSLKMRLGVPEGPEAQKVHIYFAGLVLLTPEGAESYTQQVGHFYLFT